MNYKVDEALVLGWNKWSGQAAELQIFRVDHENHKEGQGLYKMDEKEHPTTPRKEEDLIEEFHSLTEERR